MPAPVPYFLDTNLFIYAFDPKEPNKQARARELLEQAQGGSGAISYQVVQEFLNVCLIRKPAPMTPAEAEWFMREVLMPMVQVYPSLELFSEALSIHRETQWRYYDALLVASAKQVGCGIFYTEDLNHGQVVRGVRIVNPFD